MKINIVTLSRFQNTILVNGRYLLVLEDIKALEVYGKSWSTRATVLQAFLRKKQLRAILHDGEYKIDRHHTREDIFYYRLTDEEVRSWAKVRGYS